VPGARHHSCTTSSEEPPLSIFNSYWDIPINDGGAVGAHLFADALYGGASLATGSDLSFVGSNWNDRISSITVPSGRFVTIYADADYGGVSLTLTQSVPDLTQLPGPGPGGTWNDAVSSIRTGQNCSVPSISPTSVNLGAASVSGSVSVTQTAGCNWGATSNSAFVTITSGSSGSGNGAVGYSVVANPTFVARTGSMTIAGLTFAINQARADLPTACNLGSDPVPGSTVISGSEVTLLRSCIDALRAISGLSAHSWTDSITAKMTVIRAVHLTELRSALLDVYSASGISAPSFGSAPTASVTVILASHFIAIRDAIRAGPVRRFTKETGSDLSR